MPRKMKVANRVAINEDDRRKMKVLESAMMSRKIWSGFLGQTFGGDRDIYEEAGWKKNPTNEDFYDRFSRQDIAGTIVKAFPESTWSAIPIIREDNKPEDTEFEAAFRDLADETRLWHYLLRLDIMAGVGRYAVLLVGMDDGVKDLSKPAGTATKVLYLQPYYERDAEIDRWDKDMKSPRFGLPDMYRVKVSSGDSSNTIKVHHSRILHVADGCLESDVFGVPRLERIFNRLEDIEKILGASAEGFWKQAFKGAAFVKSPDAEWGDDASVEAMQNQIEDYYNRLTRWMRLSGMDIKEIPTGVSDPKNHWDIQLAMLACASRIPVRILMGSERGELASTQDERAWLARIDERRKTFAGPGVVRLFVKMMIERGILKNTEKKWWVEWPTVDTLPEKERAEVARIRSEAIANYTKAAASGADMIVPPMYFLVDILGIEESRASEYLAQMESMLKEEEDDSGGGIGTKVSGSKVKPSTKKPVAKAK